MKTRKTLLNLCHHVFFLFVSLFATCWAESDVPLLVKLSTELKQKPLFLAHFSDDQAGLEVSYLRQLEHILAKDLEYSGYVQLLPYSTERETLAKMGNFGSASTLVRWKTSNAMYVIVVSIKERAMSGMLLFVESGQVKIVEGLALTGELGYDRQQVHQLSDAFIKAMFGQSGIASKRLLYTRKYRDSNSLKWISELWESDYDGANARKILNDDYGYCVSPVYIPSLEGCRSGSCLYVSYKSGQPKIYIALIEQGISRRLLPLRANQLMPAMSRQRDKIAFISDATGNPDLFLQELNLAKGLIGKPRQIYSAPHATQGSPAFSPDGSQIAFVSNKDGSPKIYLMPIPKAGSALKEIRPTLLCLANSESSAPCWSPDGSKIAFCARNRGEDRQIWIYDFESNRERPLTSGAGNKENPSWAPDSFHLAYNTTEKEKASLYMINLNDLKPIKIDDRQPGEKHFPSWE